MYKKTFNVSIFTALTLLFTLILFILFPIKSHAISEWDGEYFTYGAGLSDSQLEETRKLLDIEDKNIEEVLVDSTAYNKFTGGTTQDSRLYSSAVIVKTSSGSGVNVYINTPENITKIKDHQYINAALTSGITDSDIIVASPVQVTGESALAGIYKALEDAGVEVNEEAAQVSSEELTMTKEVAENNQDKDSEELTLAIAEIKEKIANMEDRDSLTREEIKDIINETLDERDLELSEKDKDKIANWADKFKGLDIDWDKVGSQLKDIGNKIAEKTEEFYDWGKESGFFSKIIEAIKSFFKTLFG